MEEELNEPVAAFEPRRQARRKRAVKAPRWTHASWDAAIQSGRFDHTPQVELVFGEIHEMAPIGDPHYYSNVTLEEIIREIYRGRDSYVVSDKPLVLEPDSQPEPDIAVIPGSLKAIRHKPRTASLVIEISDSSLTYDRTTKQQLYALNRIPEYWILNLQDRQVEVFRNPEGKAYATQEIHLADGQLSPLDAPDTTIAVRDLFLQV